MNPTHGHVWLRIGPACEAGLSAGMRRELVKEKGERKKEREKREAEDLCGVIILIRYLANGRTNSTYSCEILNVGRTVGRNVPCTTFPIWAIPQYLTSCITGIASF